MDKRKMTVELFDTGYKTPELPECNKKTFGKVNPEALKLLDNPMKLWVTVYKMNMTKQPVTMSKLLEMFDGAMPRNEVMRAYHTLTSWYMVEEQYGMVGEGRAGRVLYIDNDEVQTVRKVYEEHVRPLEPESERIEYVDGIIIEK